MDVEEAYRILDLEVGSTLTEVKEQYKLLLQFYHPDKHTKSPEKLKHKATLKYAEIDQAYKYIQKNPSKKKSTPPPPKKKKTSSAKEKDLYSPFWIVKENEKTGEIKYHLKTNSLTRLLEKQGFSIYKEGGEDNTGGAESYIQDVSESIFKSW
jgi:curved DNA-binding protein CbpA